MNKTFFEKKHFSLRLLLHQKLKNLINCLDTNKAAVIDTIPLKLIKIAAAFLTPLLTVVIKSIEENISPGSAKIASVIPLDK